MKSSNCSGRNVGQTSGPMPLGFEARSHACQRRFGRQRQSGGPVPPHPSPLPRGEGATLAALRACGCARYASVGLGLSLSTGERAGVRGNWAHAVSTVPGVLSMTPPDQVPIETPRASFIPAQGNALGSWPQKPSGALKARLILAWHEAGRWPATAKRAMNPGRCPGLV